LKTTNPAIQDSIKKIVEKYYKRWKKGSQLPFSIYSVIFFNY
jgi:hypothetical protein